MTDARDATKDRNRTIAHNEEARQVAGAARVSITAMAAVVIVVGVLVTLGWMAMR